MAHLSVRTDISNSTDDPTRPPSQHPSVPEPDHRVVPDASSACCDEGLPGVEPSAVAALSTAERKVRHQLQQRRAMNQALLELAKVQAIVEPTADLENTSGASASGLHTCRDRKRSASEKTNVDIYLPPKLDLVGRTINSLRGLHGENLKLKQLLGDQGHPCPGPLPCQSQDDWLAYSIPGPTVALTNAVTSMSPHSPHSFQPEPTYLNCDFLDNYHLQPSCDTFPRDTLLLWLSQSPSYAYVATVTKRSPQAIQCTGYRFFSRRVNSMLLKP